MLYRIKEKTRSTGRYSSLISFAGHQFLPSSGHPVSLPVFHRIWILVSPHVTCMGARVFPTHSISFHSYNYFYNGTVFYSRTSVMLSCSENSLLTVLVPRSIYFWGVC